MVPDWATGVAVICVAFFGGVGLMTRVIPQTRKNKRLGVEESVRLDALEGKVEDLEQAHRRIAELEERLDFAERMLAKQHDVERLAPPRS